MKRFRLITPFGVDPESTRRFQRERGFGLLWKPPRGVDSHSRLFSSILDPSDRTGKRRMQCTEIHDGLCPSLCHSTVYSRVTDGHTAEAGRCITEGPPPPPPPVFGFLSKQPLHHPWPSWRGATPQRAQSRDWSQHFLHQLCFGVASLI